MTNSSGSRALKKYLSENEMEFSNIITIFRSIELEVVEYKAGETIPLECPQLHLIDRGIVTLTHEDVATMVRLRNTQLGNRCGLVVNRWSLRINIHIV